jgi:hypothetical protein
MGNLLMDLSDMLRDPRAKINDNDLALAMLRCVMKSKYMPGDDRTDYDVNCISECLVNMGEWVEAASVSKDGLGMGESPAHSIPLYTLVELSRFGEALALYVNNRSYYAEAVGDLHAAVLAAAAYGRADLMEEILALPALKDDPSYPILESYLEIAKTEGEAIPQIAQKTAAVTTEDRPRLVCQLDLMMGRHSYQRYAQAVMSFDPVDRQFWKLFDGYEKISPSANAGDYYTALARLHPNDQWCIDALSDYKKRVGKVTLCDAAMTEAKLAEFPMERWPAVNKGKDAQGVLIAGRMSPFEAASAVFQLLDKGETKRALEVALRFHYVTAQWPEAYARNAFANHLIHIAEEGAGGVAMGMRAE